MRSNAKPAKTEATIFADLWDRSSARLTPTVARYVLKLGFSEAEQARMLDLLRRNQVGQLASAEVAELDGYINVADLLAILQPKARQALKRHGTRSAGKG